MHYSRQKYLESCLRVGMSEQDAILSTIQFFCSPACQDEEFDYGFDPSGPDAMWEKMNQQTKVVVTRTPNN